MVLPNNISLLRIRERIDDSSFLENIDEQIVNNNRNDELIFDGEFDVQFSIIKHKVRKKEEYNVKFDLFTGKILELSPLALPINDVRFSVIKPPPSKLLDDLVQSKIAINKVAVFFNEETTQFELVKVKKDLPNLLVDATSHLIPAEHSIIASPVSVAFNWITKKIVVKFNSENYKKYISRVKFNENSTFSKSWLVLYFSKSDDHTNLLGKVDVDFKRLMVESHLDYSAPWLSDMPTDINVMHSPELGFVVSIDQLSIIDYINEDDDKMMRPQILYKQQGTALFVQSIMENTDNYNIQSVITLYISKQTDPGLLLGKIEIKKEQLNDFGSVNLIMNYKEKISISSDHPFIYIEDNDVSTYYKF